MGSWSYRSPSDLDRAAVSAGSSLPLAANGIAAQPAPAASFVAVLIGGTTLGIIGALIAIPVAAAIRIILQETVFPRLDRT